MIGQIKTKKQVYCEICGSKYVRTISVGVEANTPEAIDAAKAAATKKVLAPYTCRICQSITAVI